MNRPNVIYVFSDQHRMQACGFRGDPNVSTPNLDRLAGAGVECTMAVSGMPVCCPYRASLLTGQYPHHHGVFLNDLCLMTGAPTMAELFKAAGYETAYIGKWHLDGHGRSHPVPRSRRHGFDFWRVMECTHDYNNSFYYNESDEKQCWDGYDAAAQTDAAIAYIQSRNCSKAADVPFLLVLSWGPPHDPYGSAPEAFRNRYDAHKLILRDNVPAYQSAVAREELAGYYAHVSALDAQLGRLMDALHHMSLWEDTIFVYTSDHGDMLRSQGVCKKQKPWEEAIRIPFLLSWPRRFGSRPVKVSWPLNTPDILPTLLTLCGIDVPATVDGRSLARHMMSAASLSEPPLEAEGVDDFHPSALLQCIAPNGEWHKFNGGRPYRGIRTRRYTYVKDLSGPWLLYDNISDPFQLVNLLEDDSFDAGIANRLEQELECMLAMAGDAMAPAGEYVKKWGHEVDFLGTHLYE